MYRDVTPGAEDEEAVHCLQSGDLMHDLLAADSLVGRVRSRRSSHERCDPGRLSPAGLRGHMPAPSTTKFQTEAYVTGAICLSV